MAVKKDKRTEEEEEDLLEEELEQEEESQEDGDDSAKEEEKKEPEEKKEEASDEDSDEEESASSSEEVDEETAQKRERRRREKRMRKERDKREKLMLSNTIKLMAEEIQKLKSGYGEVDKTLAQQSFAAINNEIRELGSVYNQAQAAMKDAIDNGDGAKYVKAKEISDKAWARYNLLEMQKKSIPKEAFTQRKEEVASEETDQSESQETVKLGQNGKRYGMSFVNRNKDWYDPNGGNRDSKIVLTIDTDLYNEGYDPESKEYWDELEDRCKEYLPHRFKKHQTVGNKPKQTVGGTGDNSSPAGAEKSLPKEFVQTLKAAGYWEDPVKRKAAIKNFYANKKGA